MLNATYGQFVMVQIKSFGFLILYVWGWRVIGSEECHWLSYRCALLHALFCWAIFASNLLNFSCKFHSLARIASAWAHIKNILSKPPIMKLDITTSQIGAVSIPSNGHR